MFDKTAHHYDWINSVMSFGSGVWYRREALKRTGVKTGATVLDVCTGTGLVARPAVELVGREGTVLGFDASLGMLVAARRSLEIPLLQGYVEKLPFSSCSVDFVTMGYALRHVADLNTPFNEFFRVLRPGGRLLILEATRPTSTWRYWMVRIYLRRVVPLIAKLGGRDASTIMRYFWDTIDNCVPPATILDSLKGVGFTNAERREIFGLFSEYDAEKPQE
jgi:demethylmenaquinone methyltransferase/2-methoxy-6-polyprenyl-1,4-benzoquinol methylase